MYFWELRNIQKAWKTRNIRKARNIQETRKNRKNRKNRKARKTRNIRKAWNIRKTRNIQKARKTLQYTHGESNPNQRNRNPSFYPLNYGCIIGL